MMRPHISLHCTCSGDFYNPGARRVSEAFFTDELRKSMNDIAAIRALAMGEIWESLPASSRACAGPAAPEFDSCERKLLIYIAELFKNATTAGLAGYQASVF